MDLGFRVLEASTGVEIVVTAYPVEERGQIDALGALPDTTWVRKPLDTAVLLSHIDELTGA